MTDHNNQPRKPAADPGPPQSPETLTHEPPPHSLTDFKGTAPRVEVTRQPKDPADVLITKSLIDQYTQEDGFHCPACKATITDLEQAVYHLADEINKAMQKIGHQ